MGLEMRGFTFALRSRGWVVILLWGRILLCYCPIVLLLLLWECCSVIVLLLITLYYSGEKRITYYSGEKRVRICSEEKKKLAKKERIFPILEKIGENLKKIEEISGDFAVKKNDLEGNRKNFLVRKKIGDFLKKF
mgnify:FL=1